MKKIVSICLSAIFMTSVLNGCAKSSTENGTHTPNNQQSIKNSDSTISNETKNSENIDSNAKQLVVYFSVPETSNPENMSREEELSTVVIDGKVLGNTQYVANVIAEYIGADIFRIEPVTPYPLDHSELEKVAQQEQQADARPEIANKIENMEQYNTIYLGFP